MIESTETWIARQPWTEADKAVARAAHAARMASNLNPLRREDYERLVERARDERHILEPQNKRLRGGATAPGRAMNHLIVEQEGTTYRRRNPAGQIAALTQEEVEWRAARFAALKA